MDGISFKQYDSISSLKHKKYGMDSILSGYDPVVLLKHKN